MSLRSESHWWYLFYKDVKSSTTSTTWVRIWQTQTRAWEGYPQMHLLDELFFFWGCWSGFSERRSQNLSNGTNVASKLATLSVFTSIVYRTFSLVIIGLSRESVAIVIMINQGCAWQTTAHKYASIIAFSLHRTGVVFTRRDEIRPTACVGVIQSNPHSTP
jgi:hypothetical protein